MTTPASAWLLVLTLKFNAILARRGNADRGIVLPLGRWNDSCILVSGKAGGGNGRDRLDVMWTASGSVCSLELGNFAVKHYILLVAQSRVPPQLSSRTKLRS